MPIKGTRRSFLIVVGLSLGAAGVKAGTLATYTGGGSTWTDASHWSSKPYYPDNGNPAGQTYDAVLNALAGANVQLTQDVTVDNFTLNSGLPYGNFKLNVNGTFTWTGGDLALSSTNTYTNVVISGTAEKRFDSGTINNAGTITWTGKSLLHEYFAAPTLNNLAGATFGVQGVGGQMAGVTVNNAGTYDEAAGAATNFDAAPFNNAGVVNVKAGAALYLGTGGTSGGTYNVDATGKLSFASDSAPAWTMQPTAVINAQGTLLLLSDAGDFHGTLNATGPTTIGTVTFYPDAVLQNLGSTLTIGHPHFATGKAVTLPATVLPQFSFLDGPDAVTVAGPLTWSQGTLGTSATLNGDTAFSGGSLSGGAVAAAVTNNATFTFASAVSLETSGTASFTNGSAGLVVLDGTDRFETNTTGPHPVFNNYGTIRKIDTVPPPGTSLAFADFGATLNNYGTVDVRSGGVAATSLDNEGTITLPANTSLALFNGTISGSPGSSISGDGSVKLGQTTGTISGNYDVHGGLDVGAAGATTHVTFGPDAKVKDVGALLSVYLTSSVTFNTGQTINLNDVYLDGDIYGPDKINVHGSLSGLGTIHAHVTPHDLAPGHSPGALTLTGGLTLLPDSTTQIQLGGTAQGNTYDLVAVTGGAGLDGTLDVSFWNGFNQLIKPSDTFTVVTADGLSGAFANAPDGGRVNTSDGLGSFQVSYANGEVVLSGFSTALVPEPSSAAVLCIAAGVGLVCRRRRRQRRHHD